MKLILIRHGETIENQQKILQGQIQGTLSALGKEQARAVAQTLAKEKIDAIYSSDLARAADTAKEIGRVMDIDVVFKTELRERNLGEFQGKSKKVIRWDMLKSEYEKPNKKLLGGESVEDLY
ncbi:MAG TPA: histidine phosphatase family protein [Candidatus Nanoarchaeia archaeon]|nr:histidine phosphatase family protein [Candidatus Nanoarchaeia archaeon]